MTVFWGECVFPCLLIVIRKCFPPLFLPFVGDYDWSDYTVLFFFSDSRDGFPQNLSWSIFNVRPFFTNLLKSMAFWNPALAKWCCGTNQCLSCLTQVVLCCSMVSGRRKTKTTKLSEPHKLLFLFNICVQIVYKSFPIYHPLQYYSFFLWFLDHLKYQLILFFRESFKQPFGGSILTKLQGVDLNVCRHSLPGIACGYHRLLC